MSAQARMLDTHEAKIAAEHAAMWSAYDAGNLEDAYHHWDEVKRLIRLRSPITVDQMERRMGLAGSAPTKSDPFYTSDAWRAVRYQALQKHGGRCQCCGRGRAAGAILHVDHIKPRSKFPELELSVENLQILCEACNLGKSNRDDTDWRE